MVEGIVLPRKRKSSKCHQTILKTKSLSFFVGFRAFVFWWHFYSNLHLLFIGKLVPQNVRNIP